MNFGTKRILEVICLLVPIFSWTQARSGAWVHERNKFYLDISSGQYKASKLFDQDGNKIPNEVLQIPGNFFLGTVPATYKQFDTTGYIEYGLGWDTEININFPFYINATQSVSAGNYSVTNLGDLQVGLKYKWMDLPWLVSAVEVVTGIPTGNESATSNKVNALPAQIIPTGDGEYDVALKAHFSRGFQALPVFLSANVGYRFRDVNGGTSFVNDLPWGVDVGYTIPLLKESNWLQSLTISYATRGLRSFASPTAAANTGLIATGTVPGQSLIDIQPGLFLNIWSKLALTTSYSYTVWGENTGAGWSVRGGLAWAN